MAGGGSGKELRLQEEGNFEIPRPGACESGGLLPCPLSSLYSFVICSFRAKYHKLKFGTDLNQGEKKAELSEQGTNPCILSWPPSAQQLLGIEKLQVACAFLLCSMKSNNGHRGEIWWNCILSASFHQSCSRYCQALPVCHPVVLPGT